MKTAIKSHDTVASPDLVADAVINRLNADDADSCWKLMDTPDIMRRPWSALYFITLKNCHDTRRLVVKIACYPDQKNQNVSCQTQDILRRGQREY